MRTLALSLAFACLTLSGVQAGPFTPLRSDLDRLAAEHGRLQHVLRVQAFDPSRLAQMEVRLQQLEESMRELRGRVEEAVHAQAQAKARQDDLITALERRIAALEGGSPPPVADAGGTSGTGAPPPPRDFTGGGEQSLGSVSAEAVGGLSAGATVAALPSGETPREQYDNAMRQLRAGNYANAQSGLQAFIEAYPDDPLAANAAYWLGESHYVQSDYAAAASVFGDNYRTYGTDAAKAPDNLLKLGMALHQLGQDQNACVAYDRLTRDFPNAPVHISDAVDRERRRAGCS